MKFSSFLFLVLISCSSFAQNKETIAKELWYNNIQDIMLMEKVNILNYTNFPLEGEWAMVHGIEGEGTRQDFMSLMEEIFPAQMRKNLETEDHTSLHLNEVNGKVESIVYTYSEFSNDGEEGLESAIIFTFKLIREKWLLVAINYAG